MWVGFHLCLFWRWAISWVILIFSDSFFASCIVSSVPVEVICRWLFIWREDFHGSLSLFFNLFFIHYPASFVCDPFIIIKIKIIGIKDHFFSWNFSGRKSILIGRIFFRLWFVLSLKGTVNYCLMFLISRIIIIFLSSFS